MLSVTCGAWVGLHCQALAALPDRQPLSPR